MFPKVNSFLNECVQLAGGDLPLFERTAEEIVGVAESFKKGGEKRGENAGIAKKELIEFFSIHEVEPGGFEGAGGSGARFVIEKSHFAEDIPWEKVAERSFSLALDENRNFDPALQDTIGLRAFFPFAEDDLAFGKRLFTHTEGNDELSRGKGQEGRFRKKNRLERPNLFGRARGGRVAR